MTNFNLKLGQKYDITYLQSQKSLFKNKTEDIKITLKNLMFYKSTNLYFKFWTGSEFVTILKTKIFEIKQL